MDDLLAARSQMAMSLAFHIIFAAIGIAMPLLMIIAEWKWLRSKDDVYLTLAKRWAKGTAAHHARIVVGRGRRGRDTAISVVLLPLHHLQSEWAPLWSAVTCYRFGKNTKAPTSWRTPRWLV